MILTIILLYIRWLRQAMGFAAYFSAEVLLVCAGKACLSG